MPQKRKLHVDIGDALLKELKHRAVNEGVTLTRYVQREVFAPWIERTGWSPSGTTAPAAPERGVSVIDLLALADEEG